MPTIASPVELHALEKRREKELEEARSIQNVMLPNEALQAGMKIWIPPGLFDPSVSYEALELPLEPGIRSCFSPTAEDENFGLERLQAVCAAQAERAAAEFLGKICGSEQICRRAS